MKIRKGFVSNSSSSSFIVDANASAIKESSNMSDFTHISLKEFLKDWLICNIIFFRYDYKMPKILTDEDYVNEFINGYGEGIAPECVENVLRKYINIYNKHYDKWEDRQKELNKVEQVIIDKIYHLLYSKFEDINLVYFSASDHDYIDDEQETTCEKFWLDEIWNYSGFKYIFNEH